MNESRHSIAPEEGFVQRTPKRVAYGSNDENDVIKRQRSISQGPISPIAITRDPSLRTK
jgi:hypothetical protein